MTTISINYGAYNSRRYSRPWGAVVKFSGTKVQYNFDSSSYLGDDSGGQMVIECNPGDIIASGQKDGRNLKKSINDWYIVNEDGTKTEITRADAFSHWQKMNK